MTLAEYNMFKLSVPVNVRKAIKQGKIVDSYREIYDLANSIASKEALELMQGRAQEYLDSKYIIRARGSDLSIPGIKKEGFEYKKERLQYHLKNLIKLTEVSLKAQKNEDKG